MTSNDLVQVDIYEIDVKTCSYLISLVDHQFGRVEFQITSVLILQLQLSIGNNNEYSKFNTPKSMSYQGH